MDDPSAQLTDEEIAKVLDEDRCPRCNGYTVEFHAMHERDSSNDYRDCTTCKWRLGDWEAQKHHERELEAIRKNKGR